jgi:hypothetical protein
LPTELIELLGSFEQPGSGLVRRVAMRDRNHTSRVGTLAVVQKREEGDARGRGPRRRQGARVRRAKSGKIIDGTAEFVDLTVVIVVLAQVRRSRGGR